MRCQNKTQQLLTMQIVLTGMCIEFSHLVLTGTCIEFSYLVLTGMCIEFSHLVLTGTCIEFPYLDLRICSCFSWLLFTVTTISSFISPFNLRCVTRSYFIRVNVWSHKRRVRQYKVFHPTRRKGSLCSPISSMGTHVHITSRVSFRGAGGWAHLGTFLPPLEIVLLKCIIDVDKSA